MATLPNGDTIAPGAYMPDLETGAADSQKTYDRALVHVNNARFEIDMERELPDSFFSEEGIEQLEINAGAGPDSIFGTLEQFALTGFVFDDQGDPVLDEHGDFQTAVSVVPPELGLHRIAINGGDEAAQDGSSLPGDTINVSGISLQTLPADKASPPAPTLVIDAGAGDDDLTGRGVADFIDGGPGTDDCSNAEVHINCEADVTVTAVYDNNGKADEFGTYILGVPLQNEFTVTVPGADAITTVSYDIHDGRWTGTADRTSETSEDWTFTFDTGNLTTSSSSGRQDFALSILVNDTEAFSGLLRTEDVNFTVDVRPISVGPSPAGVGDWIPFQNTRFIAGLGGDLQYRVRADVPLFEGTPLANPYAGQLQLLRRNAVTDERTVVNDNLNFVVDVNNDTSMESAIFELPNSVFENTDNIMNATPDWGLYLSPLNSTVIASTATRSTVVNDTPDWLGMATDVTRMFVTTQDVLPDAGEQSAAGAFVVRI